MRPLTDEDYPVVAQGPNVYRRTESSPICTCMHPAMASEIALRLNRDNQCYPGTIQPSETEINMIRRMFGRTPLFGMD